MRLVRSVVGWGVPALAAAVVLQLTLQMHALAGQSQSGIRVASLDRYSVAGCAGTCLALGGAAAPVLDSAHPATTRVRVTLRSPALQRVGLRLGYYQAPAASSTGGCSATDPAAAVNLRIGDGRELLYAGTLSGFASTYGGSESLAIAGRHQPSWATGEAHDLAITYSLNGAAGAEHTGCHVQAVLVWVTRSAP